MTETRPAPPVQTTDHSRQDRIDRRTFWVSVVASIVGSAFFALFFQSIVTASSNFIVSSTNVIAPIAMIALFGIIFAGPAVSIRANATFQRRLMALTPVISEEERKQLLGKWAMMNSKAEYLEINTQLEEIANKYHVALPQSTR
jgi:hypothetical protein